MLYINAANSTLRSYNCDFDSFLETYTTETAYAEHACQLHTYKTEKTDRSLKCLQQKMKARERDMRKTTTEHSDQRFIKGKNKESKQKGDKSAMAKIKQLNKSIDEIAILKQNAIHDEAKPLQIRGIMAES